MATNRISKKILMLMTFLLQQVTCESTECFKAVKRVNKDTSFEGSWQAYKHGFGKVCVDYWLGNENIYKITRTGRFELRIDMVFKYHHYYVSYSDFYIENESQNYRLHFGKFITGYTHDMLKVHNGQQFSTPDRDNDHSKTHCAGRYRSGWWYADCHHANLNGKFGDKTFGFGVIWETLTTD